MSQPRLKVLHVHKSSTDNLDLLKVAQEFVAGREGACECLVIASECGLTLGRGSCCLSSFATVELCCASVLYFFFFPSSSIVLLV